MEGGGGGASMWNTGQVGGGRLAQTWALTRENTVDTKIGGILPELSFIECIVMIHNGQYNTSSHTVEYA